MTARLLAGVLIAGGLLGACERKPAAPVPDTSGGAVSVSSPGTESISTEATFVRRGLYKRAFEQAQKETTADNLEEKLSALEREIDLDWQRAERE